MNISRLLKTLAALTLAALLGACAHPISLSGSKAPERVESLLIDKKVAYVINDADRAKQVITPGGGGDKVSYFPYRDLEKSIRDALRSVYRDVVAVKSVGDTQGIKDAAAVLVFTPQVTTTSSSPSPLTWPPTVFTTEISCVVTDASGKEIARVVATGNGAAEFQEFKGDFSLSAKRATDDVAARLAAEIRRSDKLR
jgi:hypothetical protein